MLNFGASKPRVKGSPAPGPPPGSAPDVTEIMRNNIQPCPLELSSYLAASFQCVPSNEILNWWLVRVTLVVA